MHPTTHRFDLDWGQTKIILEALRRAELVARTAISCAHTDEERDEAIATFGHPEEIHLLRMSMVRTDAIAAGVDEDPRERTDYITRLLDHLREAHDWVPPTGKPITPRSVNLAHHAAHQRPVMPLGSQDAD